ncbi:hypothetical protein RB195_018108 [Necator americanus]|uniref:Uncharacterized protein n=2 Tax=Necator americanus TaxID=51031 RepID=A0ABR1C873_NECAM
MRVLADDESLGKSFVRYGDADVKVDDRCNAKRESIQRHFSAVAQDSANLLTYFGRAIILDELTRTRNSQLQQYPNDCDTYEMYSVAYYEEGDSYDTYDRNMRNSHIEVCADSFSAVPHKGKHIALIEITNDETTNQHHNEVEQLESVAHRIRADLTHRPSSGQKNIRMAPSCNPRSVIPPPPPAPSGEITAHQRKKNELITKSKDTERSSGRERGGDSEPREKVHEEKALGEESSGTRHRSSPSSDKSERIMVVNMRKSLQNVSEHIENGREPKRMTGPRGKPSTNPFGSGIQQRTQLDITPHQINSVQQVVRRMNSGDWPIKIDDEGVRTDPNPKPCKADRMQGSHRTQPETAHNWETLPRNKAAKEIERANSAERVHFESHNKGKNSGMSLENKERHLQRFKDEKDYRSDSSEPCEHTTVSTDSAFASEDCSSAQQLGFSRTAPTYIPANVKHMDTEARLLLLYFKGHRVLLNYLGIGLTESLWHRISTLPLCEVQISIIESARPPVKVTNAEPKNSGTPIQGHRRSAPSKKARRGDRHVPAQSPRLVALERQLRTDVLDNDWGDRHQRCSSDCEVERRESKKVDSRGGRFVKKSAAALIAKKQGYAPQNGLEEANSSEIVDPRIANEIRALREREEELRKSRTELGLPTLDDIMCKFDEGSFASHGGLRSAHSCDHLHQLTNGMICSSQPQVNRSVRFSTNHNNQGESDKKNTKTQQNWYFNTTEDGGQHQRERSERYAPHSNQMDL